MYGLDQPVLRTDISGMPLEWIDYQEAVRLHCAGHVAFAAGTLLYTLRGGCNAVTGRRSLILVVALALAVSVASIVRISRLEVRAERHWLDGRRVKVNSRSPASSRLSATAWHFSRHLRRKALRRCSISSALSA